jgi:hypothetical protein
MREETVHFATVIRNTNSLELRDITSTTPEYCFMFAPSGAIEISDRRADTSILPGQQT